MRLRHGVEHAAWQASSFGPKHQDVVVVEGDLVVSLVLDDAKVKKRRPWSAERTDWNSEWVVSVVSS